MIKEVSYAAGSFAYCLSHFISLIFSKTFNLLIKKAKTNKVQ